MDFKDFIIGEKYNISALAIEGSFAMKKYAVFKLPTGRLFLLRAEDFEAVSPENGIKNTEPAPKYDPNRLFRKGDKVRLVKYKNRTPYDLENYCMVEEEGCVYTLPEDETEDGFVCIDEEHSVCVCYLELVTPVEEQEPYSVSEATVQYLVKEDNKKVVAQFCKLYHPHAKAAAEAERDRLNAEFRKEKE